MRSGGRIGTMAAAMEAGHHLGDYWVQTDHQAAHKGLPGLEGAWACAKHVATYTLTQALSVGMAQAATGRRPNLKRVAAGLAISAITHYAADRRDHGLMVKLAKRIPGKDRFLTLGVPREPITLSGSGRVITDNPSLGTGAWALDQSWHLFLGVFIPALVMGDDE